MSTFVSLEVLNLNITYQNFCNYCFRRNRNTNSSNSTAGAEPASRSNGINQNGDTDHWNEETTGNGAPLEASSSRTETVPGSESRVVENGAKPEGNYISKSL